MGVAVGDFQPWLDRWGLTADGEPFRTDYTGSLLLPVCRGAERAMLKVATERTEIAGAAVMAWWDGEGAAPVLAYEPPALLLVRAEDEASLTDMVKAGRDHEATEIICRAVAGLHRLRQAAPPATLETSVSWFRALRREAQGGGPFAVACAEAEAMLADPREPMVLHGDIHHGNILDFGPRGWLAIDPKGLVGDRTYEYANMVKSPDLAAALQPGRARRQVDQIARLAGLDPERLRRWAIAHAGLSAAWCLEDGVHVADSMQILEFFLAELGG